MTEDEIDHAMKIIADRLKESRIKKGITQLEFSFRSGVSQGMITYIEQGNRNPALKTVLKLCDALDIRFSDLLEGIEPITKESDKSKLSEIKKDMENHIKELSHLIDEIDASL